MSPAPKRPSELEAVVAALDAGLTTLRGPDIEKCLGPRGGFAFGVRAKASGAALRMLILELQQLLVGRSTRLGFAEIDVTGELTLDELVFDRSLAFLRCTFDCPVTMRSLACRSLTLDESHFVSLDARVLSLRGNLFLRGTEFSGPLLLRDSSVEGVIDCDGARFGFSPAPISEHGGAMPASDGGDEAFGGSRIRARALFWRSVRLGTGRVTLRDAEIVTLRDDMKSGLSSWPHLGRLSMSGFAYAKKSPAPLETHIQWLELEPEHFVDNGRALIACLDAANAQDDAAHLAILVRKAANRDVASVPRRWSRNLYLALQELSFRPEWVGLTLAVLYLASAGLTTWWHALGLLEPVDRSILSDPCFRQISAACMAKTWTAVPGTDYALPSALHRFNGFAYAVDLLFPYAPDGRSVFWGGRYVMVSALLLILRTIGFALQASLLWSLFGTRDKG